MIFSFMVGDGFSDERMGRCCGMLGGWQTTLAPRSLSFGRWWLSDLLELTFSVDRANHRMLARRMRHGKHECLAPFRSIATKRPPARRRRLTDPPAGITTSQLLRKNSGILSVVLGLSGNGDPWSLLL